MATIAPKSERKEFVLAPLGTHVARCISFIHIGTNEETFKGEPKMFNKIRLTFELPNELMEFADGKKPMVHSQEYTLSMAPKANLRRLVEGMLGVALRDDEADAFDTESIVGMPCLMQIIHKTSAKGNKRAEIASAMPLAKGQIAPSQVNPSKILSYGNWDKELFEAQPNFIKDKIMSSREYQAMIGGTKETLNSDGTDTEDIPF